jgi:TonB family protein
VPRLGGLALTEADWTAFLAWATSEGREGLPEAAAQAVALGSPSAWAAVLSMARRTGTVIDEAVTARAIGSDSAGVRERTYWHLVASAGGGGKALEPVLAAAPEARPAPGVDPLALLAFELLGRTLGRPATDRTALIQGLSAADRRRLPGDARALAALRGPEKAAYGVARFDDPEAVDGIFKAVKKAKDTLPVARERRVRTVSDLTPGLAADVMALTGCSPSGEPRWAALEVRHDEKGAVAALGLSRSEDLGACEPSARALLLMASAPTDRPFRPRETDMLVLPLLADFTGCLAEPEPSPPPAGGSPGRDTLVPGQKTKSTAARYPSAAARERRQGAVVLQIGVNPSGCVRSAEVLGGEHVDLEAEALRTVVQWRYAPTLLDGRAVPTVLTVTVNFRLN